jgi:hypothetical protein
VGRRHHESLSSIEGRGVSGIPTVFADGVANIFKLMKNKRVIAVKTHSSLETGTLFTRFTFVQV